MATGGGGGAVSSDPGEGQGRANSAIFVKSNFLLKIGMQAIVALMKTRDRDLPSVEKSNEGQDLTGSASARFPAEHREKILAAERRQPIEKSRFGGENSRKRKKKQDADSRKSKER
jgi:hypothetical protein